MKIYTRTGDDGTTSLAGGRRIPKFDVRVEAYGSVDELISWIGLLRSFGENDEHRDKLIYIQDHLMRIAATVADDSGECKKYFTNTNDCISFLEVEIDSLDAAIPAINNFILPGGNILVSYCHIARCVCRRAERAVLKLNSTEELPDITYKFLNRLSDYLFVLSRNISQKVGNKDIKWKI
jgi:cob(I)alamin adenosyltransferase